MGDINTTHTSNRIEYIKKEDEFGKCANCGEPFLSVEMYDYYANVYCDGCHTLLMDRIFRGSVMTWAEKEAYINSHLIPVEKYSDIIRGK